METRSITVSATGCHDCRVHVRSHCCKRICPFIPKGIGFEFVGENIENKTFNPSCPMVKEPEEIVDVENRTIYVVVNKDGA